MTTYTGTYQTLEAKGEDAVAPSHIKFKQALLMFDLAAANELQGFKWLAKEQVETCGKHITFMGLLDTAKGFPRMAQPWFQEYLQGRVKEQFDFDYTFFTSGAFIKNPGEGLAETEPEPVPESSSVKEEEEAELKKKGESVDSEPPPEPEPAFPEPLAIEAAVQEPDAVEKPEAEGEDEWGIPSWGKKKKDPKKGALVEVTEDTTTPVQKPNKDNPWGSAAFDISKKTKKSKKGALHPNLSSPPPELEPELPPLKKTEALPLADEDDMWIPQELAPATTTKKEEEESRSCRGASH
jgi:hypothetical protein